MALLHFLKANGENLGVSVCALNCDHKIRGKASCRDSAFVKLWCRDNGIPIIFFSEDCIARAKDRGQSVETAAREWRRECYVKAAEYFGADAVATAHHLNDNAETVLFNIARGAGVSGAAGIGDSTEGQVKILRPLIGCTRAEIEAYAEANGLPYTEDKTNSDDNYTRNYIRHKVLPALENAVPHAAESIFRFSRLARDDEEYFNKLIYSQGLIKNYGYGVEIKCCAEKAVFRRAAVAVVKENFFKKDYTCAHIEKLYELQFSENGKKFEFLGLAAVKNQNGIIISQTCVKPFSPIPFKGFKTGILGGLFLEIAEKANNSSGFNTLKFDLDSIPDNAVIRTRRDGDRFIKFGGGEKSLGDFFTDRKIPVCLRDMLPLIAAGNKILAVCGVEISDTVKISETTTHTVYINLRSVK